MRQEPKIRELAESLYEEYVQLFPQISTPLTDTLIPISEIGYEISREIETEMLWLWGYQAQERAGTKNRGSLPSSSMKYYINTNYCFCHDTFLAVFPLKKN